MLEDPLNPKLSYVFKLATAAGLIDDFDTGRIVSPITDWLRWLEDIGRVDVLGGKLPSAQESLVGGFCALVSPPLMSSCHLILEPYGRWNGTIYRFSFGFYFSNEKLTSPILANLCSCTVGF